MLYFHYFLIEAYLFLLPHFVATKASGELDWAMCSYYPQVASSQPTAGPISNRKQPPFEATHFIFG